MKDFTDVAILLAENEVLLSNLKNKLKSGIADEHSTLLRSILSKDSFTIGHMKYALVCVGEVFPINISKNDIIDKVILHFKGPLGKELLFQTLHDNCSYQILNGEQFNEFINLKLELNRIEKKNSKRLNKEICEPFDNLYNINNDDLNSFNSDIFSNDNELNDNELDINVFDSSLFG